MLSEKELAGLQIRYNMAIVKLKKDVWHQRLLSYILPDYAHAVTTIGNTIYVPRKEISRSVQLHEAVHLMQYDRLGILKMALLYLCSPLPIFLCYGRFLIEREAYIVQISYGWTPQRCAEEICSSLYFWPWPKSLVLKWFEKEKARRIA